MHAAGDPLAGRQASESYFIMTHPNPASKKSLPCWSTALVCPSFILAVGYATRNQIAGSIFTDSFTSGDLSFRNTVLLREVSR